MVIDPATAVWYGSTFCLTFGVPLNLPSGWITERLHREILIDQKPSPLYTITDLVVHALWAGLVYGAAAWVAAGPWGWFAGIGAVGAFAIRAMIGAPLAFLPPSKRKGTRHAGFENWKKLMITLLIGLVGSLSVSAWGPSVSLPESRLLQQGTIVFAWGLFAIFFGGRLVGVFLDSLGHQIANSGHSDKGDERQFHEEESIGRLVGYMERLVLYSFTLFGAPSAAAIVIAVKAFVQFPELKSSRFTAFYIIGTLWSVFIGVAIGLLVGGAFLKVVSP